MVAAQQQKTGALQVLVGKIDDILQYAIGDPMRYIANWGRLYSLWPVHLETACCVPPQTILLGDNKPISQYRVGDVTTGVSGRAQVVQTFDREYSGELIEVTGRGMLPLLLTPEHPVLVGSRVIRSGKGEYLDGTSWKEAGELIEAPPVKRAGCYLLPTATHDCLLIPRVKGYIDMPVVPLNPYATGRGLAVLKGRRHDPSLRFPLTSRTAWLLGIYVAEGWTTKDHDVFFSLSKGERALAKQVSSIARSLGYNPQVRERETALVVRFSSSILARALRSGVAI